MFCDQILRTNITILTNFFNFTPLLFIYMYASELPINNKHNYDKQIVY